jgi:hypothetical protein
VSEPGDYERYRALLEDADDEQKRLTLFHLLFAERARDRLASESKAVETEPRVLQALPITSQPPLDEAASASSLEQALHGNLDDEEGLHLREPSEPVPPEAGADIQVVANPSPRDDVVDMIANLLSSRPHPSKTTYMMAQSLSPVTGDVNSIASQIQAALAKLDRPPS